MKFKISRDFPSGPVVRLWAPNAGGTGLIPVWGSKKKKKNPKAPHTKKQKIRNVKKQEDVTHDQKRKKAIYRLRTTNDSVEMTR